jgi:hypothetical protein
MGNHIDISNLADELGVDAQLLKEHIAQTPLVFKELKQQASAEQVSVDSLIERDLILVEQSEYPSADCYDESEVLEFVDGTLSPDRLLHRDHCEMCRILLACAIPTDDKVAPLARRLAGLAQGVILEDRPTDHLAELDTSVVQ